MIREIWIGLVADQELERDSVQTIAVMSLKILGVDFLRTLREGGNRPAWKKRSSDAKEVIVKAAGIPPRACVAKELAPRYGRHQGDVGNMASGGQRHAV